jgi:hypothetical protein
MPAPRSAFRCWPSTLDTSAAWSPPVSCSVTPGAVIVTLLGAYAFFRGWLFALPAL